MLKAIFIIQYASGTPTSKVITDSLSYIIILRKHSADNLVFKQFISFTQIGHFNGFYGPYLFQNELLPHMFYKN